ncbi:Uncharacterized protein Fot_07782 [Forsythia ovata]|uniref:Uncharacterized protein n=1 Tax=Forsythia ovata TaxID=205694 RepID=A0ABD1WZS3_9LAMI
MKNGGTENEIVTSIHAFGMSGIGNVLFTKDWQQRQRQQLDRDLTIVELWNFVDTKSRIIHMHRMKQSTTQVRTAYTGSIFMRLLNSYLAHLTVHKQFIID